ncbi:MAG: radical SAM protein [Candidatus Aenigmarchaeota archaeon]|nr:radical SAM protein [Candidatus Aenigmarchaeota archaeon]
MLIGEIAERLKAWNEGGKAGPLRMELHPTDRCNLRCIFCWRAANLNKNFPEMSERRLLKIPKEAAELGVKEWVISGGGEPLVRKEATLKVLKRIKQYDMWGLLTTNGTLLKERDAKFLVKIGWDQVQFSIDGPNPEINDYLRGKGSFEKIVQNIKILRKVKDNLKSNRPYIGFNTVLSRLNFDKLDDMMRLANEVGSELVYFEPLYPGYTSERLDLNGKEKALKKHVKNSSKTAKDLGIDTNIDTFYEASLTDKTNFRELVLKEVKGLVNGFISAPCFRPWYLMGIKASGFAGCCSTFEEGEFINKKNLKEVWFGKVFNKIRQNMIEKKIPDYCSKCSVVVVMENREIRNRLIGMGS